MGLAKTVITSKSNSHFFSINVKDFVPSLELRGSRNSYMVNFLNSLTITKNGIDLDGVRYDAQKNLARQLSWKIRTIINIENDLVRMGILNRKRGRINRNLVRYLSLSEKTKKLALNYVSGKKPNKSLTCKKRKDANSSHPTHEVRKVDNCKFCSSQSAKNADELKPKTMNKTQENNKALTTQKRTTEKKPSAKAHAIIATMNHKSRFHTSLRHDVHKKLPCYRKHAQLMDALIAKFGYEECAKAFYQKDWNSLYKAYDAEILKVR